MALAIATTTVLGTANSLAASKPESTSVEEVEALHGETAEVEAIANEPEAGIMATQSTILGCDTWVQLKTQALFDAVVKNGKYKINFIGRYLKNAPAANSLQKEITAEELKIFNSAKMPLVSLFQYSASSVDSFNRYKGIDQASKAVERALKLNQPNGTPIYFCVDYNPEEGDFSEIIEYFVGIQSVLNSSANTRNYKMGVYGNSKTLDRVKAAYPSCRKILCCSDPNAYTDWDIYQENHQEFVNCGSTVIPFDIMRAKASSYGGWNSVHTHTGWTNYGNASYHRVYCSTCNSYVYEMHVPNSTGLGCSVCGYRGSILIHTPNSFDGADENIG